MTVLGPLRLGGLVRAGWRGVSEYTGMVLGMFLVQFIAAWSAGLVILQILATAFADRPLFDDAVDLDLTSLLLVVRDAPAVFSAVAWVVLGAIVMWSVWSWFLTGGVLAVLTERPRGRRETARCFGAGGAATFLVYARLGLVSIVLNLPALLALGIGQGYAAGKLEYAVNDGELVLPLLVGFAPAMLLHVVASTIVDYARAELTLRRPTHETLGAIRTTIRATGFVFRRPIALGHVLVYWLVFVLVSLAFVWVSHDHAMLGTSGALALFAIRQGVTLLRTAVKIALLAGQVELTATRPPPPRTIATVDA